MRTMANVKRRRRRGRLLKYVFLLFLLALFFHWSNHSLQIQRFTYASPRLPAGFDGCVIVQLSDLHGAVFGEDNADLLREVRDLRPDYIFLTGDLLDRYRRTPHGYAVDLCRGLAEIAPTFFVTGNHEWALPDVRGLKRELAAAGATVLTNEYLTLERGGDSVLLAGIDDPNGYADQKSPEELAQEVRAAAEDPFWILLAHRNNYFPDRYSRRAHPPALYRRPYQRGADPFPLLHRRFLHRRRRVPLRLQGAGQLRAHLPPLQPAGDRRSHAGAGGIAAN